MREPNKISRTIYCKKFIENPKTRIFNVQKNDIDL